MPRPALVIQSDQFAAHATVTVLLVSSTLVDAPLIRVTVHPSERNGLRKPSQVMVDKAMTVKRERLGRRSEPPVRKPCWKWGVAWRCSWGSPGRLWLHGGFP
jgi:mRNA-degrading endonuclease toxin of MazEF toxin-antitoxin module